MRNNVKNALLQDDTTRCVDNWHHELSYFHSLQKLPLHFLKVPKEVDWQQSTHGMHLSAIRLIP